MFPSKSEQYLQIEKSPWCTTSWPTHTEFDKQFCYLSFFHPTSPKADELVLVVAMVQPADWTHRNLGKDVNDQMSPRKPKPASENGGAKRVQIHTQ